MRNWNSVILPSCLVPCVAMALTTADLTFESGSDASNYSVKGKPNNTYSVSASLPQDVLTNVYSMLPEGTTVNSAFIAPERYSSIDIDDELDGAEYATATITFLNEGAGYRNTLGYFVFDTNNPPATKDDINAHVVVFPNTSVADVGEMQEGDSIDLSVQLTAGQTLAFFIISNGWGWEGSYNNIPWLGGWGTPFYSYPALNPEATAENRRHNVAFLDTENEFLVLGFEDIYRPTGDNDFNDLIFTVEVTPFTAVDGVNEDGTTDSKYEVLVQENNEDVTVTTVYPSSNSYATIAFEDNWPLKGDYDFNDVVWRYKVTEQLNGQRELKNLTVDYTLQAMGAGYSNGYAVKLPNVLPANVASTTLTRNGVAVGHTILQAGDSETILMVSEDLRVDLENLGELSESCVFYRTQSACSGVQNADVLNYQLYVEFTTAVSRDDIGYPPYDSFIFGADGTYHGDFVATPPGMTWQTHLKEFTGTSDMNNALLNSHDDSSSGSESFKTSNNMPWVINIRDEWDHPVELVDISDVYTSFPTWVTSSGETDGEWYKASTTNKVISATDE
ncbi:LruC domain-containing protein [Vibrio crassostreae]|uniref:LruC domain-containing protein n=1 Tax=Vibrio crassostreae TaxID=246167 RepID=UPI001047ABAC|nr:LruC domain-containing protein [Vibrio crassostreae]TCW20478.1 LruC domain-containing protein [Vibrio crassostreae]CAK3827163.1 LruC domain-containing protein [Vibrio crassostreae]